MRWTLRRRLVVMVVALVAVVAVGMGAFSALALHTSLTNQVDEQLRAAHQRASNAPMWLTNGNGQSSGQPTSGDSDDRRPSPGNLQPGQATGTVNLFSDGDEVRADYIDDTGTLQQLDDAQVTTLLAVPQDDDVHVVDLGDLGSYRALSGTGRSGATAVTALPTTAVTHTVTTFVLVESVIALLALLAAGTAGLVLVRRELRPLDRVAATATRVTQLPLDRGEVDLAERVPERDTDPATEVGQVGSALNQLLGHVGAALSARHESEVQVRQFVADASHELRTPLASIRGYAELVRRSDEVLPDGAVTAMGRIESEASRMTTLVEDMLLLARLDAGRPLEAEPVDLTMLALDAVGDAHAAGPDHVWLLDVPDAEESDDQLVVTGDEHRLRQVFANLLANARLHTPAGTTVTVRVRPEPAASGAVPSAAPSAVAGAVAGAVPSAVAGAVPSAEAGPARGVAGVRVEVVDDGPGIPDELRDRLFQRFTRGDASRTRGSGSTGLGLAIVQAVVGAHGGTIEATPTPGGGTTFTVLLPSSA
ncbi:cell wall metabolism sensor histidine kinase WalK, partial [Cellulomonas sp. HZM]|uniref:sensor histidine kinase n=1 Tax=Cellulomonas sp. HZM TaxID=1454010 RepID=UPI000493932F